MGRYLALLAVGLLGVAAGAAPLEWPMDQAAEVTKYVNLGASRVSEGLMRAESAWDPHFYLRLPEAGVDARELTWLEVRMYSSAPADLLDIYYQSPDGAWCLGGKLAVAQGWATYRMDLRTNRWRETTLGESAHQWGGPSGRVAVLRLDPGNEARRQLVVDYVRLTAAPADPQEGVTVEPPAPGRVGKLDAPARVVAGESFTVATEVEVTVPPGLRQVNLYLRLRQGAMPLWAEERTVAAAPRLRLSAPVRLARYSLPGTYVLEVGSYELALTGPLTREVQVRSPLAAPRPAAVKLTKLGGDPAISVNGQPLAGIMACINGDGQFRLHRDFARAGLHVYSDWFGSSQGSDMGHTAADTYDYAVYDRYFAAALEADPEAYFLPHIGVTAPIWWQVAHPEECAQYANGRRGPSSFASELWRRDSGEDLRKLLAHLQQAPYASRLLGIIFYSGATAEWQMWGTWLEHRDDYSEPALRAFRKFLRGRYATDAALQAAWDNPQVTLDTAPAPDWAQRRPGGPQVLRDPRTERPAMDYYEFINNLTAEALLHFARISREATGGRLLVGTYYAYLSAHAANQVDSGHCAAAPVFDSPDIDFLMSPPNYLHRLPGDTSTFMSATDSFRLRGKLWLNEADNRTFLAEREADWHSDDLPQSLGVLWRELALTLTKRAAVSYFDMSGGWYDHPDLMAALGKAERVMAESLPARRPFSPEVCLVVDPRSFYYLRPTEAVSALVREQLVVMPQAGVPFDYVLMDDLGASWLPDYKVYFFLNTCAVDPAQRTMIRAKLRRNGATGVFFYAPGYFRDGAGALANVTDLTGVRMGVDETAGRAQLQLAAGSPLAAGLDSARPVGSALTLSPVYYAADPQAEVLAKLAGSERAGLVRQRQDGWTAVYSAAMALPPALLRNLCREAGAHIWVDTDDAVYTDGQYLGLHAATAGAKLIHLPGDRQVTDLLTGKALPVTDGTVRLSLQRAETRLLRLTER
jgi:hypothetical protein